MAQHELTDPDDVVLTIDDFPELTDEELTRQALAAEPNLVLDDDTLPLFDPDERGGLLPGWYMPTAVAHSSRRSKRAVVVLLIVALLLVVASGFCITYGALTIA
jgi:hypothetical protein